MSDLLEIYTFGGLAIKQNGKTVAGFASRKVEALLVYLACTNREHPREILAEFLWEERSQAQSFTNLRVVLSSLRQQLASHIITTRQTVRLNPDNPCWLDIAQLQAGIQTASEGWQQPQGLTASAARQLELALSLYKGDFLAGFTIHDSAGFENWMLLEREQLRGQAIEALHHLTNYYVKAANYSAGITHATRLLQLDPVREEAHRQLMTLLATTGQRRAALNQYETCRRLLGTELGVEPSEDTTALYRAIQAGTAAFTPVLVETVVSASLTRPNNLPLQPTPFIGREAELANIGKRLSDSACRLLTLVGPGGIGKTRLGLHVAEQQIENFAHGVYFVAMAPISSPGLLVSAIASALDSATFGSEPSERQLHTYLRGKTILLVLDNFEHLLDATGVVVRLLRGAPQLKILVTSRERLNLAEEWVLPIQGLPFPGKDDTGMLETFSAVQLFMQRAQRIQPGFSLTHDPASVVAICQLVEGMPLALELAATWLRVMPAREIARQIERNLDFLATPLRDVPERHQSLRAVFDHSWSLLADNERQALAELSIFRSGFDLDAADQVAGAALSVLAGLVDKSLVRLNPSGRYDLHERLRQYGFEKLKDYGEVTAAARRHFEFFLSLAEQADPHIYGPSHTHWFDRLEMDHDNVRAALDWSAQESPEAGLRLAVAFGGFWQAADYWTEGWEWLERLLTTAQDAPLERRARALQIAGELASFRGDKDRAEALLEEALAIARATGDKRTAAWALSGLGLHIEARRDLNRALTLSEESLALFRVIEDPFGLRDVLSRLTRIFAAKGDYAQATFYTQESLALARQASDSNLMGWALCLLGTFALSQHHDSEQALALCQASLPLFREVRNRTGIVEALFVMGVATWTQGHFDLAEQLYKESLAEAQKIGYDWRLFTCLAGLGGLARERERLAQAARLLGAAENIGAGLGEGWGKGMLPTNPITLDAEMARLRTQLDSAAFAAAWAEGKAMTLDQAVNYALEPSE